MIKPIFAKYAFEYDGTHINVYHANKGDGLPKHDHVYTHVTYCCAGKLQVTKKDIKIILTKESQPIVFKAGEWHEFEAIEDGTVWSNIFAAEFMRSCEDKRNAY